jgi:metal-sulfur cluster biosynthetic enzyme
VRQIVKRLCGVAISNRRAPPAMNTACMAIAMIGDQFENRREQHSILDVLVYTDTKHAWPTKEIQDRLKEAWGWDNSHE